MFDSRTPSYPQAVIDADVDIDVEMWWYSVWPCTLSSPSCLSINNTSFNWIIFKPDLMKKWIFQKDRPPLGWRGWGGWQGRLGWQGDKSDKGDRRCSVHGGEEGKEGNTMWDGKNMMIWLSFYEYHYMTIISWQWTAGMIGFQRICGLFGQDQDKL